MAPVKLSANRPPARFYRGGAKISAFRSQASHDEFSPEDWVGSTTCCSGEHSLGLSTLPDGTLLRDAVERDPTKWLGSDHLKAFGADTKILVKLLDAGERLPVHAHPHVSWARKHVGAKHGKAETWYFLEAGTVYIGLKETIVYPDLLKLIETQDVDAMLGSMHRLDVEAGQSIYVPPGMLHAIGGGNWIIEIQEPSDLSILLEWKSYRIDGSKDGHLGLGFDKAITGVINTGWSSQEISDLVSNASAEGSIIRSPAEEYFRLDHWRISGEQKCARGFAVIIVVEGDLELDTASGDHVSVRRGDTFVLSHSDGDFVLRGKGEIVIARPPETT